MNYLVFGGSGFIGRHLVRSLARDGWRIVIDPETRRPIVVEPDTG